MIGVALKGLLGRKTRAILTSLAIVLGVAMVSGTFVLTDTIQKAFHNVFTKSYQSASVVISGKEIVKGAANGNATVPAALLPKIRALPDVAAAAGGFLFEDLKLVDSHGKTIEGKGGAPTLGFGVDPNQPRFNPLTLTQGAWARGPHQIVIDAGTASKHNYRVGETIAAKGVGAVQRYKLVGLVKISGVSIGGATLAAFDVPTAQEVFDKRDQLDGISVAAKPGVSETELAAEITPLLPPTVEAKTADAAATAASRDTSQGIKIFRIILLTFGGIALFVGAFVIFNTISITVAQRAREFATLRTLGASRRQVLRSVLLESFAIGALASLIGLFAGLGLAKGLSALLTAVGIDLPKASTVFALRTVVIAMVTGTLITLVAGLFPALRATRVPPIAAVREGAVLPQSRHAHLRPVLAVVVVALGLVMLADGIFVAKSAKGVLIPLGIGTLLLFVGVAMVSNHLVRPLAALVGAPARRFGGTAGRLAAENSVRNTGRTATTAAALMIGLALVTFVATLGRGLRLSDEDALNRQAQADYLLTPSSSSDTGLFPSGAADAVASAPGVANVSSVRSDRAHALGGDVDVTGVDGNTIGALYHFDWKQGTDGVLPLLGGDGAVVNKSYAKSHHLKVGSSFTLETSTGLKAPFTVRGVYDPPQIDQLFSGIIISQFAFDGTFPSPKNVYAFVDTRGDTTPGETAALTRALAAFPDTKAQTKAAWVKQRAASINTILDTFYVLLALSVLVSLFGMVNTHVLSVFERTREFGMLRAVGMTRRQMRRMVRHESVITALIGAAIGLPLGVFLAALVTRGLSSQGVGFHLPVLSLAIFALVAIVAGVAAAVLPARRASRLNVLEALQYE
jgi:putative ABC transport system permease protein